MRRLAVAASALASFGLVGCVDFKEPGFGPQIEAGVLVTENGDRFITVRPCMSWKVTAMELRYRPAADSRSRANGLEQVAMRYEFDPPAAADQAFGPIDPDQLVAGAELIEFDQELYDLTMATKAAALVDEPTAAVGVAVVQYQNSNGEDREVAGFWYADQDDPTAWYAPGYGETGATKYTCDNGSGWDLSMLPAQ